jgi:predicted kinase
MLELILTRGIPASKKTTWAKSWVKAGKNRVRINRDDIRMQLFGVEFGCDEDAVTVVQDAMVEAALKAGKSVVVDDCNIMRRYINRLAAIGHKYMARVFVKQFNIELSEALALNAARDRVVPEKVIRDMHRRLGGDLTGVVENPLVVEKYVPRLGAPRAVIFDIDGTLALMGDRSPYEWHKVGIDRTNDAVVEMARELWLNGYTIIVLSGRDGSCYDETKKWLEDNGIPFDHLWMRAAGDMRKDSIVKSELFDAHVRNDFDVLTVFDDRDQVVKVWRDMGLPCFQVNYGDF